MLEQIQGVPWVLISLAHQISSTWLCHGWDLPWWLLAGNITAGLLVVCGSSIGRPLAAPGLGLPVCTVWCPCFSVWASTFPSQESVNSVFDTPLCEGLFQESLCLLGWMTGHGGNVSVTFYSVLIILLTLLQLNSVPFIFYRRWTSPWLHGGRGNWCSLLKCVCACVHLCRTRQEC